MISLEVGAFVEIKILVKKIITKLMLKKYNSPILIKFGDWQVTRGISKKGDMWQIWKTSKFGLPNKLNFFIKRELKINILFLINFKRKQKSKENKKNK